MNVNNLFLWTGLMLLSPQFARAQSALHYINANELTLIGKVNEAGALYHRIDTAAFPELRTVVKNLLTNAAGLAISFRTNSSEIAAKWCTSPRGPGDNMTAIAMEGLDLYIKRDGEWQYAGVGRPANDTCNTYCIVKNLPSGEKECLLYLPLYDELNSLEIGTDEGSRISPLPSPFRKNILIYGSSIVQGASASRPGLAYPARLSRETGLNFINLGLSGNAKMEKEVADMIAPFGMDAFILDCVPNSTPEEILSRTAYLVQAIRAKHPGIPIIALQSVVREAGNFDQKTGALIIDKNEKFRREIAKLQATDKDLYFITAEGMLGKDHDGSTDGIHPNDMGFDRMLHKISPEIRSILGKYGLK